MTKASRTTRYLEMYARLDRIGDEQESAALVAEMEIEWDAMTPSQRTRARDARERTKGNM